MYTGRESSHHLGSDVSFEDNNSQTRAVLVLDLVPSVIKSSDSTDFNTISSMTTHPVLHIILIVHHVRVAVGLKPPVFENEPADRPGGGPQCISRKRAR